MNHHLCEFTLEQHIQFVIWHSDEIDTLLRARTGMIAAFPDVTSAIQHAQNQHFRLESTRIARYDFDAIELWCLNPNAKTLDCSDILNTWNMLEDAFRGCEIEAEFSSARTLKPRTILYDKLFFGNNLPAITPAGEHFTPIWTASELEELSSVLRYEIACLKRLMKTG